MRLLDSVRAERSARQAGAKSRHPHPEPACQRGATLIEAMIALTVMTIGLLGLMQLQILGIYSNQGARANILETDARGTYNLANAAADMRVRRFFYLSHLGADRSSYYPLLKVKGIAEEHIRKSGVPYTIIRSSVVFGPEDHFTNNLARLLRTAPGIFPIPNNGRTLVQPLWVEDLVTCLLWALQNPEMVNQTVEIGGGETVWMMQ